MLRIKKMFRLPGNYIITLGIRRKQFKFKLKVA